MMILYTGITCPWSHRCRIVLFEKGMDFELVEVDMLGKADEIAQLNPHGIVPVLEDRELVLHIPNIINEYIDERFPHPQLMPPDPANRARAREMLFSLEEHIFCYLPALEKGGKAAEKARLELSEKLLQFCLPLKRQTFLFGEDFTLLDVAMAPLLWRLDHYGITLPKTAAPLMKYAERIFSRQGFIDALTPSEKAMRK